MQRRRWRRIPGATPTECNGISTWGKVLTVKSSRIDRSIHTTSRSPPCRGTRSVSTWRKRLAKKLPSKSRPPTSSWATITITRWIVVARLTIMLRCKGGTCKLPVTVWMPRERVIFNSAVITTFQAYLKTETISVTEVTPTTPPRKQRAWPLSTSFASPIYRCKTIISQRLKAPPRRATQSEVQRKMRLMPSESENKMLIIY